MHKAHYEEHTNSLFVKSRVLKLEEIVKLQTLSIMFRAKFKTLQLNYKDFLNLVQKVGIVGGNMILSISLHGPPKNRCVLQL